MHPARTTRRVRDADPARAIPIHPTPIHPWVQTASGRAVDLVTPSPAMISLALDVPDHLARIARFNGACSSGPYSVAQHSVLGADALYRETNRLDMAAAFLLHDAHEYVLGDIATPVAAALNIFTRTEHALALMKQNLDRCIYTAAGMNYPLAPDVQSAVAVMDARCLMTERQHLMSKPPQSWGEALESVRPLRLIGKLRVWPWPEAADEYRDRLRRYLPDLNFYRNSGPRPHRPMPAKRHLTPA